MTKPQICDSIEISDDVEYESGCLRGFASRGAAHGDRPLNEFLEQINKAVALVPADKRSTATIGAIGEYSYIHLRIEWCRDETPEETAAIEKRKSDAREKQKCCPHCNKIVRY